MNNIDKSICQISRLDELSEEFLGLCAPSPLISAPVIYKSYSEEEINDIKAMEREKCAVMIESLSPNFQLLATAIRMMK